MSEITHAPGTFCRVELITTDVEGAKGFYSGLMGWRTEDDPVPGVGRFAVIQDPQGAVCSIIRLAKPASG